MVETKKGVGVRTRMESETKKGKVGDSSSRNFFFFLVPIIDFL